MKQLNIFFLGVAINMLPQTCIASYWYIDQVALGIGLECSLRRSIGENDYVVGMDCRNGSSVYSVDVVGMTSSVLAGVQTELVQDLNTQGNNQYCYCRITYPVVSKWIYLDHVNTGGYLGGCGSMCYNKYATISAELVKNIIGF